MSFPAMLDLAALRMLYAQDRLSPQSLAEALSARIDAADPAVFIRRATLTELLDQADALVARAPVPNSLPLWGIPFAVKDNIDVAGFPTSAACPGSRSSATTASGSRCPRSASEARARWSSTSGTWRSTGRAGGWPRRCTGSR